MHPSVSLISYSDREMGLVQLLSSVTSVLFLVIMFSRFWVLPALANRKLKRSGFRGPAPRFPFGNLSEMMKKKQQQQQNLNEEPSSSSSSVTVSHDIHSFVFPYFARWQQSHGKVFIYWLGTEPFLYIAEPDFLKRMSKGIMGKSWGKPDVFKYDRKPLFGKGLVMSEGEDWLHHRHVITPAFSSSNLKEMVSLMVQSTSRMIERWSDLIDSGKPEIDIEREIISTAGEIIARTSFGLIDGNGRKVLEKLSAVQVALFQTNRLVGVPFSKFMNPKQSLKAKKLGDEIDSLLVSIIDARKSTGGCRRASKDLLGLMLQDNEMDGGGGKRLTARELVDECKTFFFAGHETTALALTWTLLLLATNQEWQNQLREEIREVIGDNEVGFEMLSGLKKMGWVMSEVLRLYPPAPNVQRQVRKDIGVDGGLTVPKGTNVWIDVVAMHHDASLWGDDVNEFRPERFRDDHVYGGCKHKMGLLPFGFGGRMCVGRNLTVTEYKVVLTLILSRFSLHVSSSYSHSPSILLSLRPAHGLPLIVKPLQLIH